MVAKFGHFPVHTYVSNEQYLRQCGPMFSKFLGNNLVHRFICEGRAPITGRYFTLIIKEDTFIDVAELIFYLNGRFTKEEKTVLLILSFRSNATLEDSKHSMGRNFN